MAHKTDGRISECLESSAFKLLGLHWLINGSVTGKHMRNQMTGEKAGENRLRYTKHKDLHTLYRKHVGVCVCVCVCVCVHAPALMCVFKI